MHVWIKQLILFIGITLCSYILANEEDSQLLKHAQHVDQPTAALSDSGTLMHSTEESALLFKPHQLYVTLAQHQSQVVVQLMVSAVDILPISIDITEAGKSLSKKQLKQAMLATNTLKKLNSLITLPKEAQCTLLHAEVTSDLTNPTAMIDAETTNALFSTDFQGIYQLDCNQIDELESLSIGAFKQYPRLKTALIEWMTHGLSGHTILNPQNTTVHFDDRSASMPDPEVSFFSSVSIL